METHEEQKQKIKRLLIKEEEEVTQILAQKYGIPYINLINVTIELDYLKLIPEDKAREASIVVFSGTGKQINVGLKKPNLQLAQNLLKKLTEDGYKVQTYLISSKSLEKALSRYKEVPEFIQTTRGTVNISTEAMEEFLSQTNTLDRLKELFDKRNESGETRKISQLLEIMISGALKTDASDIHIEPHEDKTKLRLRIDGVLHDILEFNSRSYQLIASRIKLISEMQLNIREQAQDGRFTINLKDTKIEVRSSTLPGPNGESIVLRLLDPNTISISFEDLGLQPRLQEAIEKEIAKPNGMILSTGPTGSGKTTTLYSFLKKISSPSIKIITIEDPIEYHLPNITQTQTNDKEGYTFSTGLRSILRQDPDVILVGEIRDIEAATIALNASLTGHLVLSTLHTNNAIGTIPRLIDLGANPSTIAPSINVAIAQRLVRKLCPFCKKRTEPKKEEREIIEKIVSSFPKENEKPSLKNLKIFTSSSCEKCNNIGYRGRMGIFEILLIDDKMETIILKNPPETEIKQAMDEQGFLNMKQDAISKIIDGMTSFDEVKRIIDLNW